MTSQQLNAAIFTRLRRFWVIILVSGLVFGLLLLFYALSSPVTYTSTATIFPLTGGNDNNSGSSVLNALMGGADISKNFTNENSVNIVELAMSRTTREEVARTPVQQEGHKIIAQLLLDDYNKHRSLTEKKMEIDSSDPYLIFWTTDFLLQNMNAVITKTNSFQLNFTGRSVATVKLVSHTFIDKISQFYIELKREKAKRDYEFATTKVDSLKSVMNKKDRELIVMDQHTMFTNTTKLEYQLPSANLLSDKEMLRAQYANAVANQQNAAYKLQRDTPVIKVLDEPDPPYNKSKKSPLIYGVVGLLLGLLGSCFLLAAPLLLHYSKSELHKMIYGPQQPAA